VIHRDVDAQTKTPTDLVLLDLPLDRLQTQGHAPDSVLVGEALLLDDIGTRFEVLNANHGLRIHLDRVRIVLQGGVPGRLLHKGRLYGRSGVSFVGVVVDLDELAVWVNDPRRRRCRHRRCPVQTGRHRGRPRHRLVVRVEPP
jgi:hypothetical protein